jgi:hypothetical protein
MRYLGVMAVWLLVAAPARVQDQSAGPRPVPVTRRELKQALEELKRAQPRLPLPPLTAEEKARYGNRPVVNNGRMRMLYLPADLRADFVRERERNMTLPATFRTMLFWVVARVNNCHY